jgi:hypothetical protein
MHRPGREASAFAVAPCRCYPRRGLLEPPETADTMSMPSGSEPKPGRGLTYIVVGMVAGFVFLLVACALIGWNYAVAPVSKSLAFTAVGLGALSGTVIVAAVIVYSLSNRQKH